MHKQDNDDEEVTKSKAEEFAGLDLASETLTGDIRDFLLDRVKQLGQQLAVILEGRYQPKTEKE